MAAIPLNVAWTDVEENMHSVLRQLELLPRDTDVAVLPELFSTGFLTDTDTLHRFAEPADSSPTLARLKKWARKFNFAITGSLLIKDGDKPVNRGFFIEPSGECTFYDKRHLFCLSAEHDLLQGGKDSIPVVRFRGWNIALAVCYDLRFPVWLRNTSCRYDLLVLPANWPDSRVYAWEHLLIARAIENQAYVIGANRSGTDDGGQYSPDSTLIYNYLGKPVGAELSEGSDIRIAELDGERLIAFRQRFPAWRDADKFRYL